MNHLADATSPYLRQHRDNPVDWYPWGDEAFARAAQLDRPVLVSIGYSACHWCHVMAHESFEDDEIAETLNAHFVAIKVDREERPDVDAIYMEAVSAMTGSGGWPLNVFTMPDGRPFFGGTYFPPIERGHYPSFASVLRAVHEAWTERRGELEGHAEELTSVVRTRIGEAATEDGVTKDAQAILDSALARFGAMFDYDHGGVGGAPKFPQTPMLELLLRAHVLGRPGALEMLTTTLDAMASGGIYDQLGGGFARYSVDAAWQVPHFEKMLYDQAGLARLYLHAWQLTGEQRWRQVVDETLGYVLRDLADEKGGIHSSEDADSEGEEGRFYVFNRSELVEILGEDLAAQAAEWYGVSSAGNFENHMTVLHRALRGDLLRPPAIEAARAGLFAARNTHVRPGRDDKVLTEWNAMIGSVLCEAADATGEATYAVAAERIGNFALSNLRREDGRWLRSWRSGLAGQHLGVAADYAWLVEFFTRLSTTTGRRKWSVEAIEVANELDRLFSAEDGGLYTTGADAKALVVRPRETYDGVIPAAGSVAANALIRLGALCGDDSFVQRAERLVAGATALLNDSPIACAYLVQAALDVERPPMEIVVVGERDDLVDLAKRRFLPDAVIAWGEPGEGMLWQGRKAGLAYVCRHGECLTPVGTPEDLDAAIDRARQSLNG